MVERCLAKAKVAGSSPVSCSIKILRHFMKSIIEQASSIIKAIEKAWNQAEQPKEFSIKIFEKEEKNFFGMTTKPAKIGIFFGDKSIIHEKPAQKPRPEIKECRPDLRSKTTQGMTNHSTAPITQTHTNKPVHKPIDAQNKTTSQTHPKPVKQQQQHPQSENRPAPAQKSAQPRTHNTIEKKQPIVTAPLIKEEKPPRIPAAWNEPMVASANDWLKKTLALMNMDTHRFNTEIVGKNLKLTFTEPLIADVAHEKQLFRSFAHLIMSSLRNQYKQGIKDLKVLLVRPE